MTEQAPQSTYRPEEIEAMMVMASTSEAHTDPRNAAIDFSQLTAHEIVGTMHAVSDAKGRLQQEHMSEPIHVTEVDRRLGRYELDILLDEMPKFVGVEKTRDVFTLLAESELVGDRQTACSYIGTLTLADHDYGLELWKRLLKDDHPLVSGRAWEYTSDTFLRDIDTSQDIEKMLREDGITWADLTVLVRTYVNRLEKLRGGRDVFPEDP